MDCLFCKIAAGEIPSNKIYEDDKVLAFYDIDPKAPVHFLVIPKEHIASADCITAENSTLIAHVFEVIAKIAADLKLEKGYRIVNNCGEHGGQTVGHLHFHILAGRSLTWPPG
ncbi:histidine triad nucleotide-binding protein [Hydrogenoanaerobacterium sp.]|uniref:histidine triad nucleotide-binding protein n=1 Tax=Hydrogenoanaerobacterium sp. TaxID=2953763 RepID=UPI0028988045|nr:histidine triad nucleotide-binding protein [Hydrogenoanaerobacterium sp.]